jgi:hypothetical protein
MRPKLKPKEILIARLKALEVGFRRFGIQAFPFFFLPFIFDGEEEHQDTS